MFVFILNNVFNLNDGIDKLMTENFENINEIHKKIRENREIY